MTDTADRSGIAPYGLGNGSNVTGTSSRPDITTRLDQAVMAWARQRDDDQSLAVALRKDVSAREKKIAKALADIDTWKQENSEDAILAKLHDSAAENARRQLAELDRAKKKLEGGK